MNVAATPKAAVPASPSPASPQLKVTLGWSGGNHLSWDDYTLNINRGGSVTQPTFDGAVSEARKLVTSDTVATPSFGKLSPVAGVVAVDDGFAAVRLVTPNGFQVPIDGEVANRGGGGNLLQGVDIHAHGAVQALVGADSVLDLRNVPAASTAEFWREENGAGRSAIGPWKLIKISEPQHDPEPPAPPADPYVPPAPSPPPHIIATVNDAAGIPQLASNVQLSDAIDGHTGYMSVEEAISGARQLIKADKREATFRTGLFGIHKRVGRVDSIAVMHSGTQFALHRTEVGNIDPYDYQTSVFPFPFAEWNKNPGDDVATRVDPKLEALVGWSRIGRFTSGDTTQLR